MRNSNLWLVVIATVAVVGIAGFVIYRSGALSGIDGSGVTLPTSTKTYESPAYGIAFQYPDTYAIQEHDAPGSALRKHHSVVLMDRVAASSTPEGGEGPTAITIDIFQNDLDKLSVENWVRNTSNSNFKLSVDGNLVPLQIAGKQALGYTWDGLYRGDSVVLDHNKNIVMLSVTYNETSDQIHKDFAYILATLQLF